jgi:hypothetical protein
MRRIVLSLSLVAVTFGLGAPAQAAGPIQPGSQIVIGNFSCTAGFVFTGGGSTYVSTAAHCVEEVGQDIADGDGDVFGDVAAIGNQDAPETDWSLIRVRAGDVGRVSGAVSGIGSLNGYTTDGEVGLGDIARFSGYGRIFSTLGLLQDNRIGIVNYADHEYYEMIGILVDFGDSGGPIVHQASGKALGLMAQGLGLQGIVTAPADFGPTVEGIIAKASNQVGALSLVTS